MKKKQHIITKKCVDNNVITCSTTQTVLPYVHNLAQPCPTLPYSSWVCYVPFMINRSFCTDLSDIHPVSHLTNSDNISCEHESIPNVRKLHYSYIKFYILSTSTKLLLCNTPSYLGPHQSSPVCPQVQFARRSSLPAGAFSYVLVFVLAYVWGDMITLQHN